MPALKPITLESLLRGERFAEELTAQDAATILTALAGVQLALANRILSGRAPEPSQADDSKMLDVEDVAGTTAELEALSR